jgi:hypothetical protein
MYITISHTLILCNFQSPHCFTSVYILDCNKRHNKWLNVKLNLISVLRLQWTYLSYLHKVILYKDVIE